MDATYTNQDELATLLGISQSHLSNILRKARSCSAELAIRLSRITGVPLEIILERSAPEFSENAK